MRVLVTGGAGFIGSSVVRLLLQEQGIIVGVYDAMTYAASAETLAPYSGRFQDFRCNICSPRDTRSAFNAFQPDVVMHLAAETHVDRSIDSPATFIRSNVVGTQVLLDIALDYWRGLDAERAASFRFHYISTDEVFGSLGTEGRFNETSPYAPRSPYAASKAAADHLVRAWHYTFGLPVLLTNCSNNYGPYQFPEKFIPLMILRALNDCTMPIYGDGENVRDWLFVEDHTRALLMVIRRGQIGKSYAIGGDAERSNICVARLIAELMDELAPRARPYADLLTFVTDRPGHDYRYAIDSGTIRRELGWNPSCSFEAGLRHTVEWYLHHRGWWEPLWRRLYTKSDS